MMKNKLYLYFILLCAIVNYGCKEDEYVYPNVLTEFVELTTDEKGTIALLTTDQGNRYDIEKRKGLDGLTPDSTYRTVSIYSLTDKKDQVYLYSAQVVLSAIPRPAKDFKDGVFTDPVHLQSISYTDRYINLVLQPMVKDNLHFYHFVYDGIKSNTNGTKTLNITLFHYRNNDYEGFKNKIYASVPIWYYEDKLQPNDRINIHINTYEGMQTKSFIYKEENKY